MKVSTGNEGLSFQWRPCDEIAQLAVLLLRTLYQESAWSDMRKDSSASWSKDGRQEVKEDIFTTCQCRSLCFRDIIVITAASFLEHQAFRLLLASSSVTHSALLCVLLLCGTYVLQR